MWAMYNSYIVYIKLSGQKTSFMEYLESLCHSLVGGLRSRHVRKRRRSLDSEKCLQNVGTHFPELGEGYAHRCAVCSKKECYFKNQNPNLPNPFKSSRTSIKCSDCDVFLCIKKGSTCWRDFHMKKEFWR